MNKKNIIYISVFIILILGVLGIFKFRMDFTKEKRYTLSENTVNIIKSLQKPMTAEVYLEGDFPEVSNNCRMKPSLCWRNSEESTRSSAINLLIP